MSASEAQRWKTVFNSDSIPNVFIQAGIPHALLMRTAFVAACEAAGNESKRHPFYLILASTFKHTHTHKLIVFPSHQLLLMHTRTYRYNTTHTAMRGDDWLYSFVLRLRWWLEAWGFNEQVRTLYLSLSVNALASRSLWEKICLCCPPTHLQSPVERNYVLVCCNAFWNMHIFTVLYSQLLCMYTFVFEHFHF